MEIKILYEDENVLALSKPAGLLVHSDGRSKEKTLVDWINENYPEISDVGEEQILQNGQKIKRPGIVHRLDKDTSGVIIVAKNKKAFEFLKEQFQNRKIRKVYNAVVWGSFSDDKKEGIINKLIGRSNSDFRKWSAEFGAKGELREAVTEYKVIGQQNLTEIESNPLNPTPAYRQAGYLNGETKEKSIQMEWAKKEKNSKKFSEPIQKISFLEVRPKTGRTHQIRVHLKSIGHPVVGDRLYGIKNNPTQPSPYIKGRAKEDINISSDKNIFGDKLMLHALSITLELPTKDGETPKTITIESPLPKEMEEIKNLLKKS